MTGQRQNVKILLGIKDDSMNDEIDASIEEANEFICCYCNIDKVPEGLKRVEAAMAAEIYRERAIGKTEKSGFVKAISEGDVGMTCSENNHSIFSDFSERLNSYRKVGW